MSKSPRLILLAAGGLVGALILVAVIVLLILGVNAKRQVQTLLSDALEMEVNVGGRLDIGFFPRLHITMENVQIHNRGSEIASAAQVSLRIELFPLLHKEVRMDSVGLTHVRISIERQSDGRFNFETRTELKRTFSPMDVARVSLSDATLLYTDQQSGKALKAGSCDLNVEHLQLSKNKSVAPLKSLSFTAVLACGEIRTKDLMLSEMKCSIDGKEGAFDLKPLTMRIFGGQGSGNIRADFSGSVPEYHVHYSLSKFHLAEFFKTLSPRNMGDGLTDFSTNLSMKGKTTDEMVRSAGGEASLHARDLTLKIGSATGKSGQDLVLSEVNFSIDGKEGVFDLKPLTMRVFGGQGSGIIRADFSGSVPEYHVHYSLSKFHLAQFFKTLSPRNVGDGLTDFSTNLSMKGKTTDEIVRSAGGEASLHAHDLILEIGDIDKQLSRYESSQSFNLVDVCAFFFAGPFGLAVTKGYNFASIFQSSGGSSQIRTLVSKWNMEHGMAQAKDVAMATKENRIALKGGLDFVNARFKGVTVAVIDGRGCPIAQQTIRGPFRKPEVEKPRILTSLAGPARNLLRQAKSLFGGHCDVFYAGSVAPPH
jgi:uncharacterized protein involved in outer membrane biogenesis